MAEHVDIPSSNDSIKLFLDVPAREVSFGFEKYAAALASVIKGTEPQFTLGIFGTWGTGKTTLLSEIKDILEKSDHDDIVVVEFDSWRFQHEDNITLPLLNTIYQALKTRKTSWNKASKTLMDLAICIGAAVKFKTPIVEFNGKAAIDTARSIQNNLSQYYNWLAAFKSVVEEIRRDNEKRRIVILIDDLDRCVPPKIVEVLESIKILLDMPGFVFVLALDEQIAQSAVRSYYNREEEAFGQEYLKKIVQVEFRLPALRRIDSSKYLNTLQQMSHQYDHAVNNWIKEILPLVSDITPRDMKRFVNGMLFGLALMKNLGINIKEDQITFSAMEFKWPVFTRILASDEALLYGVKSKYIPKTVVPFPFTKMSAAEVDAILDQHKGVGEFLNSEKGKSLLKLDILIIKQLFYSTIITKQEEPERKQIYVDKEVKVELPLEQTKVMDARYGKPPGEPPKSFEEVARELGLTVETVKQIDSKLISLLNEQSRRSFELGENCVHLRDKSLENKLNKMLYYND